MDAAMYGQRLTHFRKLAGLTQKQLAATVGVAPTLISDYERGKLRLFDDLIVKLATALGITADELLGRDSHETEQHQVNRRVMQRIRTIDELPEHKKKAILKTLDDLIRANS